MGHHNFLSYAIVILILAAAIRSSRDMHRWQSSAGRSAMPLAAEQTVANPDAKRWIDARSGAYHCPGTRWYGSRRRRVSMTRRDALRRGYDSASNGGR